MYFDLLQLSVFLFDVLSVTVFVIRERFVKKADLCLNLYPCIIRYNWAIIIIILLSYICVYVFFHSRKPPIGKVGLRTKGPLGYHGQCREIFM